MKTVIVNDNRFISRQHHPFIIAELSGNHNQCLERAVALVDAAADAGVDAVKIQTYTADTMTLNLKEREFLISDPNSLWYGYSLYDLYQKAATPWEWHQAIFDRCQERGIIGFSTPFDETAVDFLETLNPPLYKVASFENTDHALIRRIAACGKPIIISTGMATMDEIDETIRIARLAGCRELILLKCTSSYPASPDDSHLATIPHMRQTFDCEVGLSDHTLGIGAAVASIALGAIVIEKHFTLNRKENGVDAAFSLEPEEMRQLVTETKHAWAALGEIHYGPTTAEVPSLMFRRSLYITEDLQAGDILSTNNVRAIRPGLGLPPKYLDSFLGKKVKHGIQKGTPLTDAIVVEDTKQLSKTHPE